MLVILPSVILSFILNILSIELYLNEVLNNISGCLREALFDQSPKKASFVAKFLF